MAKISFFLLLTSFITCTAFGQGKFAESLQTDAISLESIQVTGVEFFKLIDQEIQDKPLGLGTYGQVSIDLCKFSPKGFNKPLKQLSTLEGKEIKYLSNPSCSQIVLRKTLISNFNYNPENLHGYRDRKCIMQLSKMIQPILEYYTLMIEEPVKGCKFCQSRQKAKANVILKEMVNLNAVCGKEAGRVALFVGAISEKAEEFMLKKVANLKQ